MKLRAPLPALALVAAGLSVMGLGRAADGQGPRRVTQAVYQTPEQLEASGAGVKSAHFMDAHGDPAVIPAQYACPPGYGGGYYDDMQGGYGGVSFNTDQVGPHYFDASVEYVAYRRNDVFENNTALMSENFVGSGSPVTTVLSTPSGDSDYESGFRVLGRYDIGPLSVLEFGFTGLFDMGETAGVVDTAFVPGVGGNLFSLFTGFGATPPGGINAVAPTFDDVENFEETDRAQSASVVFTSDLHSTEMSVRRYWVGYSPRVSGTLLAGFRYTKLREGFTFQSTGLDRFAGEDPTTIPVDRGFSTATYVVRSDNNLAGAQVGGDVWVGVVQGLRCGIEGKAGIYNNRYELTTVFNTTDGSPTPINEQTRDNQVAFLSETKFQIVADILPSMSIKGGYEVLFMNSLALVGNNFNTGSPYADPNVPARVPFLSDQGNALYHGWTLGFEYIW